MDRQHLTRQVAYWLYLHRGRAAGDPVSDWVAAERIVELVIAALGAATPEPETGEATVDLDPAGVALELLQNFVAEATRAEAAKRLGYKSASTVGRILCGQRQMSDDLIEKIQAAFAPRRRKAA